MALRSLVVKLKALPLRVPGSGSFARAPKPKPKDDPWAKVLAEFENPSKYGSMEEFSRALGPLLEKEFKPIQEKHQKQICFFRGLGLLLSASLGYTISTIAKG